MKTGGNNVIIKYTYGNTKYCITVNWTNMSEQSIIFQEIINRLSELDQLNLTENLDIAITLDSLVDKLYNLFHSFSDEYKSTPYNPRFRRLILGAYSDLEKTLEVFVQTAATAEQQLLADLFHQILDKLQEMVDIFLIDNAYQGKHRYRRFNKMEQPSETTNESLLSYGFEDLFIQMTDLSQLLDCLTEIQRRRLVKHIFLRYTLQEIAEQEKVSHAMISKSVAAALKKLGDRLSS